MRIVIAAAAIVSTVLSNGVFAQVSGIGAGSLGAPSATPGSAGVGLGPTPSAIGGARTSRQLNGNALPGKTVAGNSPSYGQNRGDNALSPNLSNPIDTRAPGTADLSLNLSRPARSVSGPNSAISRYPDNVPAGGLANPAR